MNTKKYRAEISPVVLENAEWVPEYQPFLISEWGYGGRKEWRIVTNLSVQEKLKLSAELKDRIEKNPTMPPYYYDDLHFFLDVMLEDFQAFNYWLCAENKGEKLAELKRLTVATALYYLENTVTR